MDLALTIIDGLRKMFELRDAIRRQRHESRKMYQSCREARKCGGLVLKVPAKIPRHASSVRMFKHVKMEKRQKIASEIDQFFRTLNLAATVTLMNEQAAAFSSAAKLFAKLEDEHGGIKLSHD
ncbi:hypothetical protein GN244_ATG10583 [Phytophthora infestans]|uniref:Uncharacterized protein n=1 Tax=Phytophthora infestans TaxID=4787 RepID=A0A833WJ20_PHYIN|nr:hypothetical protein GN244_ATG10583 [Phytophthora infestans]KAF4135564.1 hypothetical protein GN958_ATG15258 [Phytophthora infestans]